MANSNEINTYSSYRWLILLLFGMIGFITNVSQYQISAFAYKIIPQYQLTSAQFSSILNAPMLISVFLSLIGGVLGDRFGVKKVVSAGFIISIFAIFYRVFADNYWEMFFSMLLLGVSMALAGANSSKMLGLWFSQKQIGMAIGLYFFIGMTGSTVGLAVSSFFPSVYSALLTSAIAMSIVGVLWFVFAKNKPKGKPDLPVMPVWEYLGVAAKSRNVWITGIAASLSMGGTLTYLSFLPNALHSIRGVTPTTAGILASVFTVGGMLGSIFGPFLLGRFGGVKRILIFISVTGAIALYCSWIVPVGAAMWILLAIAGIISGGTLPILLSLPILLPEIGPVYAGSAGGIICTLQLGGAFFMPLLIGTITGDHYYLMFVSASLLILIGGPVVLLLPKIGLKEQEAVISPEA